MKKIASIVLVAALLFAIFAVPAQAETLTYTATKQITIGKQYILNPENFQASINVDDSKILCFDGGTKNYTYEFSSIKVLSPEKGVYFEGFEDPEGFAAVFTSENFNGADLFVTYTIEFESDAVFGELNYDIVISGFSAPLDTGLDLGGLLGGDTGIPVETDVVVSDRFSDFPTIDYSKLNVHQKPTKTKYFDSERFDPTGTQFEITLTNGKSGLLTYTNENANFFAFVPSIKENLTCYDTEVATLLLGHTVNYTPISVDHKWSTDADGKLAYVNITTDKYSENKPGYHAIVCEGCGETHDAQPHTPKYEEWTYNNDQSFVANGTESNVCADCGTVLIRDTFGTADFNTAFADMHFLKVIFEYINILLRFIGAATY